MPDNWVKDRGPPKIRGLIAFSFYDIARWRTRARGARKSTCGHTVPLLRFYALWAPGDKKRAHKTRPIPKIGPLEPPLAVERLRVFNCLRPLVTLAVDLSGVLTGNRMGSVPLGMTLGDGELDVEGVCNKAGVACQDCNHAVTCIALPVGWLKVPLDMCPEGQTCNARLGGCSEQAVPECDNSNSDFEHICEQRKWRVWWCRWAILATLSGRRKVQSRRRERVSQDLPDTKSKFSPYSTVVRLCPEFKRGRTSTKNDPRSGRKKETKVQSMTWKRPSPPTPKNFKASRFAGKIMGSLFWNSKEVVVIEYIDRRDQNNASAHRSSYAMAAIRDTGLKILEHSLYSPDLSLVISVSKVERISKTTEIPR
ncbi:hypothetical protein EVAR_56780_1 [Eumeta japonica]|uniref:Uncharacterized protein n=1 Tax=Eumeta variegata TaxID=151549 RepID=A0A4C1Z0M7_EUMVA|nr:hypothetical protein EVAR_56780_1 [Eumeta japonica]